MNGFLTTLAAGVLLGVGMAACDSSVGKDAERSAVRDGGATSGAVGDDATVVTPLAQGNNAADLETTQVIRRALLQVDGLSMSAKNLTIITHDQVVTLKGSVATAAERDLAVAAAHAAAGSNRVDDRIVVDSGTTARAQ